MFIRSELKEQAKQTLKSSFVLPFLITLAGMFIGGEMISIDVEVNEGYYATLTLLQTYNIQLDYYTVSKWITLFGIFGLVWSFLVSNPLQIGLDRFFLRHADHDAIAEDIIHPFKNNYNDSVKLMFFHDLQIFLYTLLLIIPGIIKSVQLFFVPYIINEYPHLSRQEIMEMSTRMTDGLKWEIFVYSFSFILWNIAASIIAPFTLGLSLVAVKTYVHQTNAFLYKWVKENKPYQADYSENYFN